MPSSDGNFARDEKIAVSLALASNFVGKCSLCFTVPMFLERPPGRISPGQKRNAEMGRFSALMGVSAFVSSMGSSVLRSEVQQILRQMAPVLQIANYPNDLGWPGKILPKNIPGEFPFAG